MALNLRVLFGRQVEGGGIEQLVVALRIDPVGRYVVLTVFLPQAIEHQLAAVLQVQGEPVPARLIGGQRLAAPFAVEPGRTADLIGLAVQHQAAVGLEERLAVVIRSLALGRFLAIASVALQHRGVLGAQLQLIAEILAAAVQRHVGEGVGTARRQQAA
jgi:hypothetical protein